MAEEIVSDDALFEMSDEELEAAFKEAQAEEASPETEIDGDTAPEEGTDGQEEEEFDDTEEVEEEDLEQPENQDSDDDGTEEEADEEAEEDSEEEESTDEDSEEQTEDAEEEVTEEVQPVQKLKYKANGKEFEFTQEEVMEQFGQVFGKAMDYTNKTKALAPYRKMISAMEDEKITQDDMNLMIDVLKGDKDAIAAVLKRTGTDTIDLDVETEREYQPNSYGRNETELAIKDIVDEIGGDEEYKVTHHVIEKEWDDKSREIFVKNPTLIKELHADVRNGVFDKVSPRMLKMKVLDGGKKSDLDYYIAAGQQYYKEVDAENARLKLTEERSAASAKIAAEAEKLAKVKADEAKRANTKKASAKRKAAAPTKSRAGKKAVMDYLDDSDESYEAWYKNLQDNN